MIMRARQARLKTTSAATVGLLLVALATPATAAPTTNALSTSVVLRSDAVTIAPGVTQYSEHYQVAAGPEVAHVLDVKLSDDLRLDTVESHDHVIDSPGERVSSMANRTQALAGVNGDFFAASGAPLGGVVRDSTLVKSPRPHFQGQLWVGSDGKVHVGEVDFSGSIRDHGKTAALTSVNTVGDAAAGGITEVTPSLGAAARVPAGTLVIGERTGPTLRVTDVRTSVTSIPALNSGQEALFGSGAGGAWLASVRRSDGVRVTAKLSVGHPSALISGATVLVRDGALYHDPTGTPPKGRNPETLVGVSRDGRRVLLVVIDGRQPGVSVGVTPQEAAEYLVGHGMDAGILLDGGGSSTLVARTPGAGSVSVRNHPSDAAGERPVANGIFLYRR